MSKVERPFDRPYRAAVLALAVQKGAKGARLAVLRVLLEHCNGVTGQAWPGNKIIMRDAGIASNGTRATALRWLQDAGLIVPVANATGGRNTAVCWGFGLPAWSTPESVETCPKSRQVSERENLPDFRTKPARKLKKTCPIFGQPTRRTRRTEEKDAAGRREEGQRTSVRRLSELLRTMDYTTARARLAEEAEKGALRAAENEGKAENVS